MSLVRVQSGEPIKTQLRNSDSPVVQLVERRTVNPYVTGSSPVWGANSYIFFNSPVVQLVERRTVNPYVTGSSPVWGAKKNSIVKITTFLLLLSFFNSLIFFCKLHYNSIR